MAKRQAGRRSGSEAESAKVGISGADLERAARPAEEQPQAVGGPTVGEKPEAAPRRRGRPKGAGEGPKGNVFSIRGSEDWRTWVGRLADHSRLKVADVIDRALIFYAKHEGFDEPAPRR